MNQDMIPKLKIGDINAAFISHLLKLQTSVMLFGDKGTGKTSAAITACHDVAGSGLIINGVPVTVHPVLISCATASFPEIAGVPVVVEETTEEVCGVKTADGAPVLPDWSNVETTDGAPPRADYANVPTLTKTVTTQTTRFTKPPIVDRIEQELAASGCTHAVVILDEASKAPGDTQPAIADVLHEKRFGHWKLPENCRTIIATGNLPDERTGDKAMKPHTLDRMSLFFTVADTEGLVDWMVRNGLHPAYIGAAMNYSTEILVPSREAKAARSRAIVADTTPRSFVAVHDWHTSSLTVADRREAAKRPLPAIEAVPQLRQAMFGRLSPEFASKLMGYLAHADRIASMAEIEDNPSKATLDPDTGVQYAQVGVLLSAIAEKDSNLAAVAEYAVRLRPELQPGVMTKLAKAQAMRGAMDTPMPAFNAWVADSTNAQLIADVMG